MEKQEAHEKALLHRAFSIFIFNAQNELLIQQRSPHKYHSAGLWTNTCCSHPRPGETTLNAAHRRLREEMGFDCELTERFSFLYKTSFENGLCEHELDFVFTGVFEGTPAINPEQVQAYQWISLDKLKVKHTENPEMFTSWFGIILKEYLEHLG